MVLLKLDIRVREPSILLRRSVIFSKIAFWHFTYVYANRAYFCDSQWLHPGVLYIRVREPSGFTNPPSRTLHTCTRTGLICCRNPPTPNSPAVPPPPTPPPLASLQQRQAALKGRFPSSSPCSPGSARKVPPPITLLCYSRVSPVYLP